MTVVVLLGGCSAGGSSSEEVGSLEGAPVVRGATGDAGTELGDGFTVAPGSVLLGAPFPDTSHASVGGIPVPEHGWTALFLVTGDPYVVLDHYSEQAARIGVPIKNPDAEFSVCTFNSAAWLECGRSGIDDRIFSKQPAGRGLYLDFARTSRDHPGPQAASHLLMTFWDASGHALPAWPAPAGATGPAPPPFPHDWPDLLEPGDHISANDAIADRPLVIEDGTRMVAPLAPFNTCVTGGFVAIFEVFGDPETVVRGYVRQFEAAGFEGDVARYDDDDASLIDGRGGQSGAGNYRARAVLRDGRRTYLELSRCND
jgi:hypothetical protein